VSGEKNYHFILKKQKERILFFVFFSPSCSFKIMLSNYALNYETQIKKTKKNKFFEFFLKETEFFFNKTVNVRF
jgi:hypothetical protein